MSLNIRNVKQLSWAINCWKSISFHFLNNRARYIVWAKNVYWQKKPSDSMTKKSGGSFPPNRNHQKADNKAFYICWTFMSTNHAQLIPTFSISEALTFLFLEKNCPTFLRLGFCMPNIQVILLDTCSTRSSFMNTQMWFRDQAKYLTAIIIGASMEMVTKITFNWESPF